MTERQGGTPLNLEVKTTSWVLKALLSIWK
ncbi:hypothetical protein CCACVL1_04533 [Corchorus capsularis]|uniref:Uncharacterized protein n=1 Tax=Corchorus capsularis TaxID=210143 RepID=A0A1R3JRJ8_COCAP|nr:hypothetical protein CCACVL1_04533 [Corchorus capsularis]